MESPAESLIKRAIKSAGPEGVFSALTSEQRWALMRFWPAWARPSQLEPPGTWRVWFIMAGRGWGKSRVGAETVRAWALLYPGCHIALIGRTAADVRDVMVRALMTPWKNGALAPDGIPVPTPSTRSLRWANGSYATTYSADEPRQMLGQNHDLFWADELAAWPATSSGRKETGARSVMEEVWHEGLMMSLRGSSGGNVDRTRGVVTTTPRPKKLVREILADPGTIVTRGSTYENAGNLSPEFIEDARRRYEGTRIGQQELYAALLDDVPGALWTHVSIEDTRVTKAPDMARVIVAVDPSGGDGEGNDEQGIVVVGLGVDGHCYVLADRTCRMTPDGWGKRAIKAYQDFEADKIVYEANFGGAMVEHVIRTAAKNLEARVFTREVKASRGKVVRAEPCAALYEQARVHHVGTFIELEEQMCLFTPTGEFDNSPDRVDALVWALTELMFKEPVTLGEGPVSGGVRRGSEPAPPCYDDDDEHGSRR